MHVHVNTARLATPGGIRIALLRKPWPPLAFLTIPQERKQYTSKSLKQTQQCVCSYLFLQNKLPL